MHGKRPTISSLHGVVAAAHPLAAAAGARILSNGGNAFDAAAATAATLNVVEPYMSGLAGQGLATCYIAAEKRVRVLDFLPMIPAAFPVDRLKRREDVARGALGVGSPGNLAGWCEMVKSYGSRSLADLFAPAITIARDGFPLIEFNVDETNTGGASLRRHDALFGHWAKNYTDGSGRVAPGYILRQPDLARTFEAIATEGPGLLYGGALGRTIVEHLKSLGGCITMADLEAVKPQWQDSIAASYRGLDIHVPPPPCEAFQYLLALRILEGFELKSMSRNGADHIDTVLRAIRIAAGVRIANNNPSRQQLAHLLSDEYVATLRARVRDGKVVTGPTEQWTPPPAEGHTTSFSIADRDGNLVCVTQSLGAVFGSGVVVPGTGICLNNFLYWADVTPDSPNRSKPGGPMPVCVAPSIGLCDGKPALVLGTPGSYGILQTQVQAVVQHLDYGLPLQDAIDAPRARLTDGRAVMLESRVEPAVMDELQARGHQLERGPAWTMRVGGMQGIALDANSGAKTGACDPRRDGYVVTA